MILPRRLRYSRLPALHQRRWQSVPSLDIRPRKFEPLRILFCGSDEFSVYSLFALHKLSKDVVESVDVVCRSGRRVGRGLKEIRHPLIKDAAKKMSLRVHSISTFTNWSPPSSVDLIIAVSFGLLIPPRIISLSTHGGINLHPSFLPDLHGPAPIHWAMLDGDRHAGVTIQTLHPTKFDGGKIINQIDRPGVPLGYQSQGSRPALWQNVQNLGLKSADVLTQCLVQGTFLEPGRDQVVEDGLVVGVRHARKITPVDRRVAPKDWDAATWLRRELTLGKLWDGEIAAMMLRVALEPGTKGEDDKLRKARETRTIFSQWRDVTETVHEMKGDRLARKTWLYRIELPELQHVDDRTSTPPTSLANNDGHEEAENKTCEEQGEEEEAQHQGPDDGHQRRGGQKRRQNPFLLRDILDEDKWALVYRTRDGRYIVPLYAKMEGKVTVPIDRYVGGTVAGAVQRRREQKRGAGKVPS